MTDTYAQAAHATWRVHYWTSVPVVLAILYLPQSWIFFQGGRWDSYRLHWLKMWPGLPTLMPLGGVRWLHYHETALVIALYVATALLFVVLVFIGKKSRWGFWLAAAATIIWSGFSGLFARAAYLA